MYSWLQTRQAFTPEQINEACYVDVNGNKDVFEGLRKNPKVNYDGKRFSYKVTFTLLLLWPSIDLFFFISAFISQYAITHCPYCLVSFINIAILYNLSLQAKHDVKNKNELLVLIRKYIEGIAVIDLRDAYPNVMEDLQVYLCCRFSFTLLTPMSPYNFCNRSWLSFQFTYFYWSL